MGQGRRRSRVQPPKVRKSTVSDDEEIAALPLCGDDVHRLPANDPVYVRAGDEFLELCTM